jgi:hypothetical protein
MIEDHQVDQAIKFAIEYFLNLVQIEEPNEKILVIAFGTVCKLILCYFEKMDKEVNFFVEEWGKCFIDQYNDSKELDFAFDSFCKLFLSNVQLFHEKFFSTINLQGIKTPLQVQMLLDEKYFRLVDKIFFQDLGFHFE